jgi:hypothetical protein
MAGGSAYALIVAIGDDNEIGAFRCAERELRGGLMSTKESRAREVLAILYRAWAVAQLSAPAAVQGAFIPAGNAFDAMVAVGKVLQTTTKDVLLVDPYMDEKALTDFAVQAPAAVTIRLLADHGAHKPSLKPAVKRWVAQHGATRPLEARLAPTRTLHDRLIAVDGSGVWILTQSLNAFAARSPATIVRVDPDTAALKIVAYAAIWQRATTL